MRRVGNAFTSPVLTEHSGRSIEVPARRGRTIAVVSGKGGVGKTSIAVNTAVSLANFGRAVTLVDLDVGLGNADLTLGVEAPLNLSHVISGRCEIEEVVLEVPGGVRLVAGGSGVEGLSETSRDERAVLAKRIRRLGFSTDFVVYDCGAGIGSNVLDFAVLADVIWVVSNPEPASLTDAYAMIKRLVQRKYHGSIEFIVNKAESRNEADAVYHRARGVAQTFLHFNLAYGGYVLQDSWLESAVRARRPVVLAYSRSPSGMCLTALAARLLRSPTCQSPDGLLARFVGLFA